MLIFFQRLQIMTMATLMYAMGFRWGSVVELNDYAGEDQFLMWKVSRFSVMQTGYLLV
jgi:hypothetical protein